MIPRIYIPETPEADGDIELRGETFRYIRNVLRMGPGDALVLFDGKGREFEGAVAGLDSRAVRVRVTRSVLNPIVSPLRVTLAQALPKGAKIDFIIQKATELGATKLVPFRCARSIPAIPEDRRGARLVRWRKIAAEAARQCGRADVPEVSEILSFDEMIDAPAKGDFRMILWEGESSRTLKDILRDSGRRAGDGVFAVIGPEGGFSKEEVDRALATGFASASLGRRVLRVETAALAVLTILQYELGGLGETPAGKKEA